MPHHQSARKRLKQSRKARLRNRNERGVMRAALKDFQTLVGSGQQVDWKAKLAEIYSILDIRARKGIIHPNKAARLKSRLSELAGK